MDELLDGIPFSSRYEPGRPEKDAWYSLTRKTRRRIIGLGWASQRGQDLDVVCQSLEYRTDRDWTPDDLIRECVRALGSVTQWRSEREHKARTRFARSQGYRSYWYYRKARLERMSSSDAA